MRLRAAKLTRSSVYTLIAAPRLRNPLRRHRVTGHRGPAAVGFLFLEFSLRAGRVHANEAEVRPTLHVRSRNGVYVRHERTSTSFPILTLNLARSLARFLSLSLFLAHAARTPETFLPTYLPTSRHGEKGGIASEGRISGYRQASCRRVTFGRIYWKGRS